MRKKAKSFGYFAFYYHIWRKNEHVQFATTDEKPRLNIRQ